MREKTIYEKIAEKYNTTPEEVRREMQIAIDAGFNNPDPAASCCPLHCGSRSEVLTSGMPPRTARIRTLPLR